MILKTIKHDIIGVTHIVEVVSWVDFTKSPLSLYINMSLGVETSQALVGLILTYIIITKPESGLTRPTSLNRPMHLNRPIYHIIYYKFFI